jgi:hypothetical protein
MSRGIPPQVVTVAERCSQFSRQPGFSIDRVIYSYRTVRCPDGIWHVLTSIRDAGADYSGRTNHLAQHLVLSASAASELARQGNTPAGVMLGTVCSWGDHDGFCGWLEETPHAVSSELDSSWLFWSAYTGSPYCRLNLCSDAALRGAVLIYGSGLQPQPPDAKQVLCLFAESQDGCPDKGWGITFTTSVEPNDELSDFRWIGVAEDSPMLGKVEAGGGRATITFETPAPAARQSSLSVTSASINKAAASHDAGGDSPHVPAITQDGSFTATEHKPPRIPPNRPVPVTANKQSLFARHRTALAIAALLLVCVAAAGVFLRSISSAKPIEFKGPLTVQYDGRPKSVALSDGRPVFYLRSASDAIGWTDQPPFDAGRYEIGIERSSWFGLVKHVVPTGKFLEIGQSRPVITFPPDLRFVTTKGSARTWPIEAEIDPPEAGAGKTTEYRRIKPEIGEWDDMPKVLPGEYEVMVSTKKTRNFVSSVEVTNFIISSPELHTADPPTAQATNTPVVTEDALLAAAKLKSANDDGSTVFYLALAADALTLIQNIVHWRDNPKKVELRDWLDGRKGYKVLDEKGRLTPLSNDYEMTGGLPSKRLPKSEIPRDEVVYRISYPDNPKTVYLICLRPEGDNRGAVGEHVDDGVWLSKGTGGLRLVAKSNFFSSAQLLPRTSQWVIRITGGPYSEPDVLELVSNNSQMFSLESESRKLAEIVALSKANIDMAGKEKVAPTVGNNYYSQNVEMLVGPLEALVDQQSAAQPIAAQLVKAIKEMRQPPTGQDGSADDDVAAARLFAGSFDCAFENQQINPTIVLTEKNEEAAKKERERSANNGAGVDWSRIKNFTLLSPDEFETWLLEPRQKPRPLSDIKLRAQDWIAFRLKLLEAYEKKQKSDLTGPKMALEALKAGIDKCGTKTVKASTAGPSIDVAKEQRNLELATRKGEFLGTLGTATASGTAKLQIQFDSSVPGKPARMVIFLPLIRLGPQLSQQP